MRQPIEGDVVAFVQGHIARLLGLFDLTRGGLGEAMCDIVSEEIGAAMENERSPDGTRWDELSEAYEREKAKTAPGKPMAEVTGRLKQPENLRGERRITPAEAVMVFGIDEEIRTIGAVFNNGSEENNQPARPFWGISRRAARRCRDLLGQRIRKGF